ncbi:YqaJ viral recombinase family protein [Corynebacterium stationis]|uniref:YqaJ viral recombinase family protein n=1 Tax=Corynebacterium stationis TaxID=1705 RepID=UPI0028A70554|nr:YqaJ viral recombinase family protein [Corynebacterium stationis]
MTIEIVTQAPAPGSAEWAQRISASKVPIILGLVPQWKTPAELWLEMSGINQPEKLDGDHLEWGHHAEDSLVTWWKFKNPGWQTGQGEIAYTNTDLPFPNIATLDRRARRGRKFHIIECKTTVDAKTWDSEEYLPPHVHAQVITQMGISGIRTASVVSQLGSTVPKIFDVEWDQEIWDGIVEQCAAFYETLGNAEPPMPDQDLIDALIEARETITLDGEYEIDADNMHLVELRSLDEEIARLQEDRAETAELLKALAPGKAITLDGKKITKKNTGRFSTKRVPDEARHLLQDKEVQKHALDQTAFKKKYPDIYAAATGNDTITIIDLAK